jgi:hypothetical protein
MADISGEKRNSNSNYSTPTNRSPTRTPKLLCANDKQGRNRQGKRRRTVEIEEKSAVDDSKAGK